MYEPIKGGAKTARGWFLTKGEPVRVVDVGQALSHGVIVVQCPRLRGSQVAIDEEETWVELDNKWGARNKTHLWAFPLRYADVLTVYSAQVCA